MGRNPIGNRAMTAAERQQRRRDRLREDHPIETLFARGPEQIKRAYKRVMAGQKKRPPLTTAERQRRYRKRLRAQAPPDKIIARGAAEIKRTAKRLRAIEAPAKFAAKLAKIAARARIATPLDTSTRYPVILADPGWRFEAWSRETGMDRAADNHYRTEALAEICALPVGALAADEAVLFLWVAVPMALNAGKVIEAWRLEYCSQFVWPKVAEEAMLSAPLQGFGTGYWNRNQHELLYVATRGAFPTPLPGDRISSLIVAPRGRHSEKPTAVYEMIERAYPNLPKIELFARSLRPGWSAWGDEIGGFVRWTGEDHVVVAEARIANDPG
jgi:N6-adenosine-specific RNA methylase IME4